MKYLIILLLLTGCTTVTPIDKYEYNLGMCNKSCSDDKCLEDCMKLNGFEI